MTLDELQRPGARRRLAAIAIDIVVVFVVIPVVAFVPLGLGLSWLLWLPVRHNCPDPCDGPALAGFGLSMMLVLVLWISYWPIFALWRRRTIGARLVGLRFEGQGLRRHLVNS